MGFSLMERNHFRPSTLTRKPLWQQLHCTLEEPVVAEETGRNRDGIAQCIQPRSVPYELKSIMITAFYLKIAKLDYFRCNIYFPV